ncbi:MAG TPA: hypothetical protein PLU30_24530 [Verrucomicrobiae bacterium]|nr:hypothetical protein [Verrucomicrobiae bacterium]
MKIDRKRLAKAARYFSMILGGMGAMMLICALTPWWVPAIIGVAVMMFGCWMMAGGVS